MTTTSRPHSESTAGAASPGILRSKDARILFGTVAGIAGAEIVRRHGQIRRAIATPRIHSSCIGFDERRQVDCAPADSEDREALVVGLVVGGHHHRKRAGGALGDPRNAEEWPARALTGGRTSALPNHPIGRPTIPVLPNQRGPLIATASDQTFRSRSAVAGDSKPVPRGLLVSPQAGKLSRWSRSGRGCCTDR